MPKLTFTVGSTRSGKSTYVKEWEYEQRMKYNRAVVINEDKIRLAVHGQRYAGRAEGIVQAMTLVFIRAMLESGYDVLYDETNTSLDSIRAIFEINPEAEPVLFLADLQTLYDRAKHTQQEDLVTGGVIDRHCGQLYKLSNHKFCPPKVPGVYSYPDLYKMYVDSSCESRVELMSDRIIAPPPKTYTVYSNAALYDQQVKQNKNEFKQKILKGIEEIRKEFQ